MGRGRKSGLYVNLADIQSVFGGEPVVITGPYFKPGSFNTNQNGNTTFEFTFWKSDGNGGGQTYKLTGEFMPGSNEAINVKISIANATNQDMTHLFPDLQNTSFFLDNGKILVKGQSMAGIMGKNMPNHIKVEPGSTPPKPIMQVAEPKPGVQVAEPMPVEASTNENNEASGHSLEIANATISNIPYVEHHLEGKAEADKKLNGILVGTQDNHFYFSNSLVLSKLNSLNSNINARDTTIGTGNVAGLFASAGDSFMKAKSEVSSMGPEVVLAYAGLLFVADQVGLSDGSPGYSSTVQIIEDYLVGNYNDAIIKDAVGLIYMGQSNYKYLIKDKQAREDFVERLKELKNEYLSAKTKRPDPKFSEEYNAYCDGAISRIDSIINLNLNYDTSVVNFNYEVDKIVRNPEIRSKLYDALRR